MILEIPMPDPSTDNGAFVFPLHPEEAVIRLAIKVEAGEGDSLALSAKLTPGNQTWGHEQVECFFRDARIIPLEGTYILETNVDGTTVVSAPEGVNADDRRAIVWTIASSLDRDLGQLVEALQAFPTQEIVDEAARQIVHEVVGGSLERSPLEVRPVVDSRTVEVQGVKCVGCHQFHGLGSMPSQLLELLARLMDGNGGATTVGNLKFVIENRDGVPVVQVGYLSHSSDFAASLNGILADRIRKAVQAVALKEVTEMLVRAENGRRQFCRMGESIQATYKIDPATVAARADEDEAEACAQPPETDGDGIDDVDDAVVRADGDSTQEEPTPPPAG